MTIELNSSGNQKNLGFNLTKIKDLSEKSLFPREFKVKRILPMVEISGLLYVTNQRIYFQPYHNIYEEQVVHFTIRKCTEFFRRRFKLMEVGLQLQLTTNRGQPKSAYFAFASDQERNAVYQAVTQYLPSGCKNEETPIIEYTKEWVKGAMSNYDYLNVLNLYAQRSTQDLTQYPVFPWVLKEYKSEVLDL